MVHPPVNIPFPIVILPHIQPCTAIQNSQLIHEIDLDFVFILVHILAGFVFVLEELKANRIIMQRIGQYFDKEIICEIDLTVFVSDRKKLNLVTD